MKIANGVEMIELNIGGFEINPTLIWDNQKVVLIDTGMPGQIESIKSAMEAAGVPFEKLTTVILTHQDIDHIGSLPEIVNALDGKVEVYAHELDKPYIEGEKRLIKAPDPEKVSKEQWEAIPEQMRAIYSNLPTAKVDHILTDGQVLPFGGGIEIIFTPGHTPGHVSLYLQASKTLIAGDSVVMAEGKIHGPREAVTPDMATALKSIEKYFNYDINGIICYHGGYTNDNVQEQLQKLV